MQTVVANVGLRQCQKMNQLLGPDLDPVVPCVFVVAFLVLVGFAGFVDVAPCVFGAPRWFDVPAVWPLFPERELAGAEELVLG